jgi:hypothetical protein
VQADLAYLRKHYNSLSDEALLDVDRAELTEAAQQCYDEELKDRRLSARSITEEPEDEDDSGDLHVFHDPEPDWADEAACVCSFLSSRGRDSGSDAASVQSILENAGIPCYLTSEKIEAAKEQRIETRAMVPGNLGLLAHEILDKKLYNLDVEAEWKTYFETLSDEELREADTNKLFCGLLDRIERVTRAYNEEKSRRGV